MWKRQQGIGNTFVSTMPPLLRRSECLAWLLTFLMPAISAQTGQEEIHRIQEQISTSQEQIGSLNYDVQSIRQQLNHDLSIQIKDAVSRIESDEQKFDSGDRVFYLYGEVMV